MQLGWMRMPLDDSRLSPHAVRDAVAQADALGFDQIHVAHPDDLDNISPPKHVHVGLNLEDFPQQPPRALIRTIRAAYDRFEGRLVMALPTGSTPQLCKAAQTFETLFSDTKSQPLRSDFPMDPPRPEVLMMARPGIAPDVGRAAENGFLALSAAWQTRDEIARHWPAIVAGATHSARRVRPSQWHVARCIYVNEDLDAVSAYCQGPASNFLRRAGVRTKDLDRSVSQVVIAGTPQVVAARLTALRDRVGPFGTVQCVDLGSDPDQAAQQRHCIAANVLPLLGKTPASAIRQLECT